MFGVKVKASNKQHDSVECKLFSGRLLVVGVIVEYHNGTSVYSKLTTQTQVQKRFADGVMSVTVYQVSTCKFTVPETLLDCKGTKRNE